MSADLVTLFNDFDRGRLSRRQLLTALGVAIALRPASAFAQGQCGGARARGRGGRRGRRRWVMQPRGGVVGVAGGVVAAPFGARPCWTTSAGAWSRGTRRRWKRNCGSAA